MNKLYYIFILLIGFMITSCKKSDIQYQNDFEKSQKAWEGFKKENNNTYQYTIIKGTWVGASWETTLTINAGKITKRHFKYTHLPENYKDIRQLLSLRNHIRNKNSHPNEKPPFNVDLCPFSRPNHIHPLSCECLPKQQSL